jgi:predicted dehydrogenase
MKDQNESQLQGAVIGYGFISGKGHLPAYEQRKDVKIIAIADSCEQRRQIAQKTYPEAKIYSSASELIQNEKSHLDFVDVSTPPCDHEAITVEALKAGLHVLCEKPLATSIAAAENMLITARQQKRVLFPCHNYKHAPVVKAIQQIIHSGKIGKVKSLTLNTYRNTHAKGVTEWHTHWRRENRYSGGGIAMDHGSHTFYLTFDWMGSYPTHVTAKMHQLSPVYDTEDNFSTVLTFPNGIAHAHLTWTAGVRKVIYTIQGEKGAITVNDDELECAMMKATSGPDVAQGAVTWEVEKTSIASHWMDASHVSWFNAMFDEFKKAILTNDYVSRETLESYRCIEIIKKAYESSNHGCQEMPLKGVSHLT